MKSSLKLKERKRRKKNKLFNLNNKLKNKYLLVKLFG